MQSSLSQYRDVKRSKRKSNSYKWCQEDSYTKEISKCFYDVASCQDKTGTLFTMSCRTVINCAADTNDCKHHGHVDNVPLQRGTDSACLNWHLVILYAKTLPCIELITTVYGTSTSMSD